MPFVFDNFCQDLGGRGDTSPQSPCGTTTAFLLLLKLAYSNEHFQQYLEPDFPQIIIHIWTLLYYFIANIIYISWNILDSILSQSKGHGFKIFFREDSKTPTFQLTSLAFGLECPCVRLWPSLALPSLQHPWSCKANAHETIIYLSHFSQYSTNF